MKLPLKHLTKQKPTEAEIYALLDASHARRMALLEAESKIAIEFEGSTSSTAFALTTCD